MPDSLQPSVNGAIFPDVRQIGAQGTGAKISGPPPALGIVIVLTNMAWHTACFGSLERPRVGGFLTRMKSVVE